MSRTVILSLILAATFVSAGAHAQSLTQLPILSVEGSGQVQAKPDFARITASASSKGPTLEAATKANQDIAARANALLQSLKGDGIDIETSNFSLLADQTASRSSSSDQRAAGYTAVTTFQLRAKRLDGISAVMDKLAASGFFELRAVGFDVEDNQPALDEARRKAVADARHKAEILSEAAGVKLSDVVSISDANGGVRPYAMEAQMGKALMVIPPSGLTFGVSIQISWHIVPKP